MRTVTAVAVGLAILVTLAACAAGPNTVTPEGPTSEVAGFWLGLWQGFISPVTFIVSLFNDNVGIYEIHNNGGWYDFGFLFGAMVIFSGMGRSGYAARPRRRATNVRRS